MSEASASPKSAYFWWVPEPNRFTAYSDASLSQEIFNVSVTQIESIVKPDGITDDVRRESMALIGVHPSILAQIRDLTCQYRN